jgi:hypothetical protein
LLGLGRPLPRLKVRRGDPHAPSDATVRKPPRADRPSHRNLRTPGPLSRLCNRQQPLNLGLRLGGGPARAFGKQQCLRPRGERLRLCCQRLRLASQLGDKRLCGRAHTILSHQLSGGVSATAAAQPNPKPKSIARRANG